VSVTDGWFFKPRLPDRATELRSHRPGKSGRLPIVNRDALLAEYDAQARTAMANRLPQGVTCDRDGPIMRCYGLHRGFVGYRNLDGCTDPADLDALIARTVAFFADRGEPFEWKTHGHDDPADLPERLRAHGFVAGDLETVVIGEAAALAREPQLPPGVTLREAGPGPDFVRIAELESAVWDDDWSWLADELTRQVASNPEGVRVLVAEADAEVVSAAWLVRSPGTEFAGLWGGSTRAQWRGRGIYRALVARRAQLAAERGVRYLQVDASSDSRPILERLGFLAVTTTTPYVWTPPR
jgi:GNAT superfamily N-acetyltransferase